MAELSGTELKRETPIQRKVTCWTDQLLATLQDALDDTNWDMFQWLAEIANLQEYLEKEDIEKDWDRPVQRLRLHHCGVVRDTYLQLPNGGPLEEEERAEGITDAGEPGGKVGVDEGLSGRVIGPETVRHPAPQHPEVEVKEDVDKELFRPLTHRWPQEDNIQQDTGNPGRGPNGARNDRPHREALTAWKPWISLLEPYSPPPDPPHVILYYDRLGEFHENLEGEQWYVITNYIYVAPEGVAAAVQLTEAQEPWYRMGSEAVPHVSLALHPKHQAKDLEPMVLRASRVTDWVPTQIPNLFYFASCKTYRIEMDGIDWTTLEHRPIARHHDSPTGVGLTNCIPIDFQVQQGNPIWIHQYPHKQVAELGIRDTIEGLLQAGVLEPSYSAWNTPILPVEEKKGTGKYRTVHDLRAFNDILLTTTVPVPNPYVALTNLGPQHKWFTCIDLANAFFCLPLAEQCRDIFSFTFQGHQLRYSRLPQGFALSPGLFNQVLKEALGECSLPQDTIVIQYVDDLMIAAPTAQTCLIGTQTVLQNLADRGFKVSKDKLQVTRTQVSFLGRLISQKGAGMSPAHRSTILHHPKPEKVKDMLSFLGLTGYSHNYIPDYVGLTQPLRRLVTEQGMRNLTNPLNWMADAKKAFMALKQQFAQATDLSTPDYALPFHLDVSETEGVSNGVLFQKKGGVRKVLMYASVLLDQMEKRHPMCTEHAAGVAKLIQKTAHLFMGHPLHVLITHSVVAYVNSQAFTLTSLFKCSKRRHDEREEVGAFAYPGPTPVRQALLTPTRFQSVGAASHDPRAQHFSRTCNAVHFLRWVCQMYGFGVPLYNMRYHTNTNGLLCVNYSML
ncbi:uncharacterized protein LOC118240440, partial [Electrophorus electricus]|uniref:uncharacterized protein LOC118240440 n=1 Tax=Electrophorus electricus TaxID=8005 RepID=UPI0015D0AE3A